MILRSLEGIEGKLTSPCWGINSAIRGVEEEIDMAHDRFFCFAEEICINFGNLEERIIDEIEKRKGSITTEELCPELFEVAQLFGPMPPDHATTVSAMPERRAVGLAIVKIRATLMEKIGQIKKMIDEKFDEIAKAIQETGKKSQKHGDEEDKLRKNVQKRFHEHEDFLRAKLLKL